MFQNVNRNIKVRNFHCLVFIISDCSEGEPNNGCLEGEAAGSYFSVYPSGAADAQCGISSRAQVSFVLGTEFSQIAPSRCFLFSTLRSLLPFFTEGPFPFSESSFPENFQIEVVVLCGQLRLALCPLRARVIDYGF
jgi:hypothetical protein